MLFGQQRLFSEISELEQIMKEAIYRSYVAMLSKFTKRKAQYAEL